jgi:AcrR family transcriptional regulator
MTAPIRISQAERSERSTTALLEAAADLIVEGGFNALTLASIGERAGYSRGLVTARFGSKDALIDALIRRIVGRWSHRNVLPRADGKPGLEGVLVILDAIRAQAERDPRGLRVLYSLMFEAVGPDDALRARFAAFHATMRSDIATLIARGIEDGSVRADVDAAAEAGLMVAGLRGIGYQWLLDPGGFDLVDQLAYLTATTRARLAGRTRKRTR